MIPLWGATGGLNAGLAFFLPLSDAGAGAVNTTPAVATGSPTPTFTRATSATTILSNGLIGSVGSGVARSCYSPAGVYLGYLAEEQRTNLLLQSNTFSNASWGNFGTVFNPTQDTTGPDGATSAWTFTDTDSTFMGKTQTVTVAADSSSYTASVYVKKTTGGTSKTVGLNTQITGGTTVASNARVNTDNGALLSGVAATVTDAGSYWRITTTITNNGTASNTALAVSIFPATAANGSSSDLGATTGSAVFWGAQLEKGSFATSYIPTTTASVTRNADVLTYANAGNMSGSAGSAYAEGTTFFTFPAGVISFVGTDTSGRMLEAAANTGVRAIDSGSNVASETLVANWLASTGAPKKIASSWGALTKVTSEGQTPASAGAGTSMSTATAIGIGCFGGGSNQADGTIKNVRIWTRALADSQLVALTTQ